MDCVIALPTSTFGRTEAATESMAVKCAEDIPAIEVVLTPRSVILAVGANPNSK